jgi:hypothetical protein
MGVLIFGTTGVVVRVHSLSWRQLLRALGLASVSAGESVDPNRYLEKDSMVVKDLESGDVVLTSALSRVACTNFPWVNMSKNTAMT